MPTSGSTPEPASGPAPASAVQTDDPATLQLNTLLHLTVDAVKDRCGSPLAESSYPVFLEGVPHDTLAMMYPSSEGGMLGVNFAKLKPDGPYQFGGTTTGLQLQLGAIIGEKKFHSVLEPTERDEIVTELPCLVTPPGGSTATP